jgi:hypothetical protein
LVKTTPDLFFLKEAKFLWRQNDRMLRSFTGIKKKHFSKPLKTAILFRIQTLQKFFFLSVFENKEVPLNVPGRVTQKSKSNFTLK